MDQIYRRIGLIYVEINGGGHFLDLLLIWPSTMLTKYIANPT